MNKQNFIYSRLGLAAVLAGMTGCATRPPRDMGPQRAEMPPTLERERPARPDPASWGTVVVEEDIVGAEPVVREAPPSATPEREPEARPGTPYTVKRGETLSGIASRHNMSWRQLADYNRISDPDDLRAGVQILIPPEYAPRRAPEVRQDERPERTARPAQRVEAGEGEVVVRPGDNLTFIARRHNTTVAALREVNNLTSDRIQAGQTLKLPVGAADRPAREERTAAREEGPERREERAAPEEDPAPRQPSGTQEWGVGLQLPEGEPAAPEEEGEEPVGGRGFQIVVEEGDTLESIANDYVVPEEDIRRVNNFGPRHEVQAGDRILVPPTTF